MSVKFWPRRDPVATGANGPGEKVPVKFDSPDPPGVRSVGNKDFFGMAAELLEAGLKRSFPGRSGCRGLDTQRGRRKGPSGQIGGDPAVGDGGGDRRLDGDHLEVEDLTTPQGMTGSGGTRSTSGRRWHRPGG